MFPGSRKCEKFTLARQKASCVIQDDESSLLKSKIAESVTNSSAVFTLIFARDHHHATKKASGFTM